MAENVLHDAKGGKPTPHAYEELQRAFDFFNERLFDGRIPQCLLTLQRKARACGWVRAIRRNSSSPKIVPVGKRVIIGVAQISRAREIQIDSRAWGER